METPVILALVVITLFGFMGYRDGVIKRLLEIVGLIATILLTARFAVQITPWMMQNTGTDQGPALVLTWAGLVLGGLVVSRLLARFISKLIHLTILGWVDRLGGAVLGMAIGALLSSIALVAATQVSGGESVAASCNSSTLGRMIYNTAGDMYTITRNMFGTEAEDVLTQTLEETREKAEALGEQTKEAVQEKARDIVEEKVGL